MPELTWGEPQWLTEEEFAAEVTDPMERWFWQVFTGWEPPAVELGREVPGDAA